MAKKGTFYPWRVAYTYPGGVKGVEHRINYAEHAMRVAAEMLLRGADIAVTQIDEDTRKATVLYELKAADFDFDNIEEQLADYQTPAEAAYEMVYERVHGKPSEHAVFLAQKALQEASGEQEPHVLQSFQQPPAPAAEPQEQPWEIEQARLALNEEIAAEHKAVAQALSDKGLLRHARICDLPGWPCPPRVRDIPGQKGSWGWVFLWRGAVVHDELGRLWADGDAIPQAAISPSNTDARALLTWTQDGLGVYIAPQHFFMLQAKSKIDMDADEPGRWMPIAEALHGRPEYVKDFS